MRARWVAMGLFGAVYVLGSHWLMTAAPNSPWSLVALLSPMPAAMAFSAWRARQHGLAALASALVLGLFALPALGNPVSPPTLYFAQHVAINLGLAGWFASTLRAGAVPLISQMAALTQVNPLPVGKQIYTRKLTMVWVAYFVAIVGVSVGLYARSPFDTWAFFANVGTPIAVATLFVGEYLLRYRLHPEFERSSLSAAVNAYMKRDARTHAAPAPKGDTLA